uniref:Uncharacterized protein n=1 Tax=Human herpesvirus 2 TaxID=10310 RepID=A0A481TN86_HHV2|nr:hypothetical protein [Human alphaherpesvirus 2]
MHSLWMRARDRMCEGGDGGEVMAVSDLRRGGRLSLAAGPGASGDERRRDERLTRHRDSPARSRSRKLDRRRDPGRAPETAPSRGEGPLGRPDARRLRECM